MVDVYDSQNALVLIDLSDMQDRIYAICQSEDLNFDTTIFINSMLPFLEHRDLVDQVLPNFLKEELLIVSDEYRQFIPKIRMNKHVLLS